MGEHIKVKLRGAIDASSVSNKPVEIWVNRVKYNCFHGRIDSKVLPGRQLVASRKTLYNETIEIMR